MAFFKLLWKTIFAQMCIRDRLNNLRSDQVWESVKEKIKPLGTVSINVLSQLATKIVSDFLGI